MTLFSLHAWNQWFEGKTSRVERGVPAEEFGNFGSNAKATKISASSGFRLNEFFVFFKNKNKINS